MQTALPYESQVEGGGVRAREGWLLESGAGLVEKDPLGTPVRRVRLRSAVAHRCEPYPSGADAILAMRFDATEIGGGWQEICAYGTAVRVSPMS
jgi:hypothetical protein